MGTGAHLPRAAPTDGTPASEVTTEDVDVTLVDGGSDMVELGDEGVFEPVDEHFGNHDC